ncbi:MAG: matrixin family metalloprotease [Verrucomicrobia bacterium]|nr:matrixin family metalloprotease [Verrucomicrobiota bacterium]
MRSAAGYIFALLALPCVVMGYVWDINENGEHRKWPLLNPPSYISTNVVNPQTHAIRYYLAADGYSDTNTEAELDAVRASFDLWEAAPGTYVKFEDAGLVGSGIDIDLDDGTNAVFWTKENTIVYGGMDDIWGSLGMSYYSFYSDNMVAEADIVFNGDQYEWFTDYFDNENSGRFIESVAVHEIGHWLGFWHSPVGAAAMFARGNSGVSVNTELTLDEISAIRRFYPDGTMNGELGEIRGEVSKDDAGVFGAIVVIEDEDGNIACSAITDEFGGYSMPALSPGDYVVRACPLDPDSMSNSLIIGWDIHGYYSEPDTSFFATDNKPVQLGAGQVKNVVFNVSAGEPAFRISRIRKPTQSSARYSTLNSPVELNPGTNDVYVGVFSSYDFSESAVLEVSGDDIESGSIIQKKDVFPGLNLMTMKIDVPSNAVPGLRSFIVRDAGRVAYANGFLKIASVYPDKDFNGMDDLFQRRYFQRWTTPNAAPDMNPDGDDFTNAQEFLAGSDPMDAGSFLEIQSVTWDANSATLRWCGAPGKRYRVYRKPVLEGVDWEVIAPLVTATDTLVEYVDTAAGGAAAFYRVQAIE